MNLLDSFHSEIKLENRRLIVLPVIQHDQNFEFDPSILKMYGDIKAFCDSSDIPFVDLLPTFSEKVKSGINFRINDDSHWNKKAHKMVAEMVLEQF